MCHDFESTSRKSTPVESVLGATHKKPSAMGTMDGSEHSFKSVRRLSPAPVLMSIEHITPNQNTIPDISRHRTKLLPLRSQATDTGDYVLMPIQPGSTITVHGIVEINIVLSGGSVSFQIGTIGSTIDRILILWDGSCVVVFYFTL